MRDQEYILQTFELAKKADGQTWPNPLVGAVIVKDGRVIGQGYHHQAGQDHAEVEALKNCSESPEGATIYVNLEPCCHIHKRTLPCAQRLIEEKIKKVVISNLDPNPSVNGKGVDLLRSHGIEVEHGILKAEGEKINEVFFHAQRTQTSFVHLKLATTLDGKIAMPNGESQWITGESARTQVHFMRSLHQAVMVGAETVRKDNPKLNVRLDDYSGPQPARIIFTKSGILPQEALLLSDEFKSSTLIYTHNKCNIPFPSEQIILIHSLKEAMQDLFEKKMINLFLEGGKNLASHFIQEHLVQRVSLFLNPSFLGNGISALGELNINSLNNRPRLTELKSSWFGDDLYLSGKLLCSQD